MPVAAVTVYTSHYNDMSGKRGDWLSSLAITSPEVTIDFESGFSQDEVVLGNLLDGGLTITSPNGYGYVTSQSSDMGGSSPIGTYALAVDEGDSYSFSFTSAINYFAFYILDNGETDLTVNYQDGTTEEVTIGVSGASGLNGTFLGMIFDKSVTSLYIPNVKGGDGEVGIDNIEFGNVAPVPIPSAIVLFGSGLIGFAFRSGKEKG
jgi:VCBS repeat-containing protein